MSNDSGRAIQPPKVREKDLPPAVAKKLQSWIEEQWDNNYRYGEKSLRIFEELAKVFYELGKENKD